MNMYIAQSKAGRFEVVKNLGVIDPKECEVQREPSAVAVAEASHGISPMAGDFVTCPEWSG
jgi:hypothetical protein